MIPMFSTLRCVFAALVLAGVAHAAEPAPEPVKEHVQALGADLRMQREEIEAHMGEGGRYAEIDEDDRQRVLAGFDEMERIVGGATDVRALEPEQRAELLNVQERINVLLTQARADSRTVCRRMKVIGSRVRRNTVCHTAAHWDRLAEESQEQMRLKQHSRVSGPEG